MREKDCVNRGVILGNTMENINNPNNSSSSDSSNFVGTVLSKTFGGNLKFIWQPNKNVDEYYFCKIVSGSINFEQITHKTYNVSFSLEEAW